MVAAREVFRSTIALPFIFSLPIVLHLLRWTSGQHLVAWRLALEIAIFSAVLWRFLITKTEVVVQQHELAISSGLFSRTSRIRFSEISRYRLVGSFYNARVALIGKDGDVRREVDITFFWRRSAKAFVRTLEANGTPSLA